MCFWETWTEKVHLSGDDDGDNDLSILNKRVIKTMMKKMILDRDSGIFKRMNHIKAMIAVMMVFWKSEQNFDYTDRDDDDVEVFFK